MYMISSVNSIKTINRAVFLVVSETHPAEFILSLAIEKAEHSGYGELTCQQISSSCISQGTRSKGRLLFAYDMVPQLRKITGN